MLLIPHKSGYLQFIKEGDFPIELIQLKVLEEEANLRISFNGGKFVPFNQGMKIPTKLLDANHINIRLKTMSKVYVSDHIPTVVYTLLGDRVDEVYPHAIAHILNDSIILRAEMKALEDKVQEYEEFIKGIQETGDII